MNDIRDMLVEPFRRLLTDVAAPDAVRIAERQLDVPPMWGAIESSGFLDALVPETRGGADLSLADVFPLVAISGEFALPVPFAETMVARAMLASFDAEPPAGAVIVLAPPSPIIPLIAVATHALQCTEGRLILVELSNVREDPFALGGGGLQAGGMEVESFNSGPIDLLFPAAALTAAKMAGAMVRMLDMTIGYVQDRQQFGRPLAKFQAIQHQIAVMAEQASSAMIAARIGMSGRNFDALRVAMAKCRVNEAAHQVCAIAHAVHGAIGVTEEYDLQLFTRRVKQGQLAFGSESFWAERLGRACWQTSAVTTADFVRLHLDDQEIGE